jgi:hypothetical protein
MQSGIIVNITTDNQLIMLGIFYLTSEITVTQAIIEAQEMRASHGSPLTAFLNAI